MLLLACRCRQRGRAACRNADLGKPQICLVFGAIVGRFERRRQFVHSAVKFAQSLAVGLDLGVERGDLALQRAVRFLRGFELGLHIRRLLGELFELGVLGLEFTLQRSYLGIQVADRLFLFVERDLQIRLLGCDGAQLLLERGDLVLRVVDLLALALEECSHGGNAARSAGHRVDRCGSFVRRNTFFGSGCRSGRRHGGSPAVAVLGDVAGQLAVDIGQATREEIAFGLGGGELRLQVGDPAVERVDFGIAVGQLDVQAACPVLGIGQVIFQANLVGLDGGQLRLDGVNIGGGSGGGIRLATQ